MGAGDFPADAPAGEDPVVAPSPPRPEAPPTAILFDGATRAFPVDANGRFVESHPIDQEVALALLIEFGKFPSAPEAGSTLRQTPIAAADPLQADVERRARVALRRPLGAGDIRIESIVGVSRVRGRLSVRVRYYNLRTPGAPLQTITN